ncbi:Membrane dipeptidase [Thermoanaerobacterium thermosaccharolyticum DSM 571]|uniref:Membrane dipeptidase n=1 Tax=Thermoanaerobacterium thermosaccharolyticum (strain ATCC 7956 / DSM 571 / NCIMB 9385 / NCA 3814 / NCTC 13789 / WDCM 00135 / 2032) TaxID=580327 RepID=D9TSW5_THETC|nr:dipeptidase [Thermoanaerobacterium thermosaccharolyticum]ADL68130.1 Membrane dipeptidase [Thermoanaerobacterium thermosaccharolyticum DSM 571]
MIVDFHCDTLYLIQKDNRDITKKNDKGHIDLIRLDEGMVHLQVFATFIEPEYVRKDAATKTLKMIDKLYQLMEKTDKIKLILSGKDVEEAKNESKIGALLSIEGGEALEGDLALLRMFYKLGVRAMTLTWSLRNDLGDGILGSSDYGLTSFGKDVIKEMNRLGMIVDVSHLNERGFWDAINICEKPLIASHSDCKALCRHPRNLSDEQIKAIADKGGVIGINFCPNFLRDDDNASIEDVLDHIEHIVNLVGINHVGFGSDFDGIEKTPLGLDDVASFPKILDGLKKRGFSDDEINSISHDNFERIIKEILS